MSIELTVRVSLSPRQIAELFCEMNDEDQAQFFIETAAIAATWKTDMGTGWQWWRVGRHLLNCSCSNEEARELVREIARGCQP